MNTNEKLNSGSFYHIYNKGINGENLFKEEKNYSYFLHKLEKYILPVAEINAYCLLKNHFHLLIKIRESTLLDPSKQFAHCFNSYTQSINKLYSRTGGLFQTPFRRKEVTDETYLTWLVWYIHTNPEKRGFTNDFKNWKWSSYQSLVNDKISDVGRLNMLNLFDNKDEFISFHLQNKEYYQDLTLED